MKFLFDVGVGIAAETWVRTQDYDIKAVRDLDPSMADSQILDLATAEERLVVTMDKDFGELVFRSGRVHAGVLLLRLEAATGDEKATILATIITLHADDITGKFAVYQNGKLRIRM